MSDLLNRLPASAGDSLFNIVVDTPKGSHNKFKYDEEHHCFRLSRVLPAGAVFPCDFGSIPMTLAEDGDALDVLVICEAPSFCGCLLSGRLIGTIAAKQKEKGNTIRNDRLIAVPVTEVNDAAYTHIRDLPRAALDEIEHFLVSYNRAHGREYTPTRRGGPEQARKMVAAAQRRYARERGA
jgi:inorganic pyrophosphatase